MDWLRHYRRVWAVDFEFTAPPGGRPGPLCLVARELRTGGLTRLWLGDDAPAAPPYGTGPDELFVAYYASAELGCHLALGWPPPARVPTCTPSSAATSGLLDPGDYGSGDPLAYFRLAGGSPGARAAGTLPPALGRVHQALSVPATGMPS